MTTDSIAFETELSIWRLKHARKTFKNGQLEEFRNNRADRNSSKVVECQLATMTVYLAYRYSITSSKVGRYMTIKQLTQQNYNNIVTID